MQHRKKAAKHLIQKAAGDPDARLFLKRGKEPIEDRLAAIKCRIAHIIKQRA